MRELREVIAVLREDEPAPNRPKPTLEDLPALVAESRQAGMQVEYDNQVDAPHTAPAGLAASAYRIVRRPRHRLCPRRRVGDVRHCDPLGHTVTQCLIGGVAEMYRDDS
jgi:hypothetical protein